MSGIIQAILMRRPAPDAPKREKPNDELDLLIEQEGLPFTWNQHLTLTGIVRQYFRKSINISHVRPEHQDKARMDFSIEKQKNG